MIAAEAVECGRACAGRRVLLGREWRLAQRHVLVCDVRKENGASCLRRMVGGREVRGRWRADGTRGECRAASSEMGRRGDDRAAGAAAVVPGFARAKLGVPRNGGGERQT